MQPLANILSQSNSGSPEITWHLLANRVVQSNRSSCSVASLSIAFNALVSVCNQGCVDKPLRESLILDMLSDNNLRRNLSEGTGGATLAQNASMATEVAKSLGDLKLSVEWHHMVEPDGEQLEKFKSALIHSGNGKSVIIVNYHQGVATGKDLSHGHFAPASPLSFKAAKVCIVDPSMEGVPFVLTTEHMGKAMATKDNASGQNRGFLKIAVDNS